VSIVPQETVALVEGLANPADGGIVSIVSKGPCQVMVIVERKSKDKLEIEK
jgi:hypothetical protein